MSSKQRNITNKLLAEIAKVLGDKDITLNEVYSMWQNDLNVLDMINKGLSMIKFDNLPVGIDGRILAMNLFFKGKIVAFQHETLGNFMLPMTRTGGLNANGIMTHVSPVAVGEQSAELNKLVLEDNIDCVIIRINELEVPPALYAIYYGQKISETLDLIDNTNNWLNFPIIIKSSGNVDKDKKNAMVIKDILGSKGAKCPVITDATMGIELMNLKPQYFGIELFEQLKNWKNLYYEYLGVNHHEDKKERLNGDEVAYNNEESNLNTQKILKPLQDCIKKANDMFGWDIKVSLNIKGTGLYDNNVNVMITSANMGGTTK